MKTRRQITPRQLRKLWQEYADYRRPQVSPSTYVRDYGAISYRLGRLVRETTYCRNAIEIRDWFLRAYSVSVAKRTLVQCSACCKWAVRSEQLPADPFDGLAADLREPRPDPNAYRAWTGEERDRIIGAIEAEDSFYTPWVRFLFYTGCRPEEAAGLRWEHVAFDCSQITIWEAEPADTRLVQRTKNYRSTEFPCNPRLQALLKQQLYSVIGAAGRDRIFYSRRGPYFNYLAFQNNHWRPVVLGLYQAGQVAFYGGQYHARHTWITHALKHLGLKDVAYLARVSPKVLLAKYADRDRDIQIPEF